jgi:hypothetical protein
LQTFCFPVSYNSSNLEFHDHLLTRFIAESVSEFQLGDVKKLKHDNVASWTDIEFQVPINTSTMSLAMTVTVVVYIPKCGTATAPPRIRSNAEGVSFSPQNSLPFALSESATWNLKEQCVTFIDEIIETGDYPGALKDQESSIILKEVYNAIDRYRRSTNVSSLRRIKCNN